MNETPNDEEKKNKPITDAGHLLELETEEQQAPAKSVLPNNNESPVTQLQDVPAESTVAPAPSVAEPQTNSGGVLVLQWLTYAFWFWFSVSMSYLAAVVINYFISGNRVDSQDWGSQLAYPLASVLIMLAIAFVTDKFYSKHEPVKKTGGANIIMLLHVVPFVLIAIGALVTIVFALINMLLDSSPLASVNGPLQIMLVALVVAVLLGLTAARAFYGSKRRVRIIAWAAFGLVAAGFIVAGVAGPASNALLTKEDRLIEQALPSLSTDIREYARTNDKLPANLSDVTHDSSYTSDLVQKLIDSKLVTYKANTLPNSNSSSAPRDVRTEVCDDSPYAGVCMSPSPTIAPDTSGATRFYYQLCTKYRTEKKSQYNYTEDERATYTTDLSAGTAESYKYAYVTSIGAHPAGEVCYNLYADGAYSYTNGTDDVIRP